MSPLVVSLLLLPFLSSTHCGRFYSLCDKKPKDQSFYNLQTVDLDGSNRTLHHFAGNVTLVVNLATFWGFTYQYHQLNAYVGEDSHLRVMGFPCNQFGHQEPADNATELFNGLKYVRPGSGFVPAFDIMGIGDVNGEKESFVYTYLKERCRLPDEAKFNPHESFWKTFKIRDVVWNFEKFLVDSNGVPVLRFLSTVEPMDILKISKLLLNDPSCNSCLETELKILESKYPKKWRPPYLCPNPTTSSGKRIFLSLKYFFVFVFFLVNFNFFHM